MLLENIRGIAKCCCNGMENDRIDRMIGMMEIKSRRDKIEEKLADWIKYLKYTYPRIEN